MGEHPDIHVLRFAMNISLALAGKQLISKYGRSPYVGQRTPANQSDAHALFAFVEYGL